MNVQEILTCPACRNNAPCVKHDGQPDRTSDCAEVAADMAALARLKMRLDEATKLGAKPSDVANLARLAGRLITAKRGR